MYTNARNFRCVHEFSLHTKIPLQEYALGGFSSECSDLPSHSAWKRREPSNCSHLSWLLRPLVPGAIGDRYVSRKKTRPRLSGWELFPLVRIAHFSLHFALSTIWIPQYFPVDRRKCGYRPFCLRIFRAPLVSVDSQLLSYTPLEQCCRLQSQLLSVIRYSVRHCLRTKAIVR